MSEAAVVATARETAAATRPAVEVRRVAGAPVVAVRAWLPGGARAETVPGQALVTGRLLGEGTRHRTWRELADEVEARGMMLHAGGTFESHGVALDALAEDWEEALALAADIVLAPTFLADRCAWIARQAAAELDSLGDQPEVRTAWSFLDQLYAPHRRALPLHGSVESLLSLTAADCAAFHLARRDAGLRVTVAGVIDEDAVAARVESLFGGELGTVATDPAAAGEPAPPRAGVETAGGRAGWRRTVRLPRGLEGDAPQAHLYLGHLTVPRRHPDHEALEIAGVVLGAGAGLTGRIPERAREREGLAYTATCQTVAGSSLDPGRLVAYVGTSPATVAQAERAVREELERLVGDGIAAGEMEEARSYLLGREPFRRETARQWADLLSEALHYGVAADGVPADGVPADDPARRHDRLAALTREQVEAAIVRWIRPDELRVTIGRPRSSARPARRQPSSRSPST